MWVLLGKILLKEGEEPAVLANFYRKVIQAVLLFGEDTWLLPTPIAQILEGVCVGLLQHVTKLKAKRLRDGSWRKVTAGKLLQRSGTEPLRTYLDIS